MRGALILILWLGFFNKDANCEFMTMISITANRIWACTMENSKEGMVFQNIKLYKINREAYVDFDLRLKFPVDDQMKVAVKSSYWTNGGYKPRFSMPLGSTCSGLKGLLPVLFAQLVNTTTSKDCPIPPGTLQIRKFLAQSDFSLPVSPGKYKSSMIFSKNDAVVGCLNLETTATPVKNKKKP